MAQMVRQLLGQTDTAMSDMAVPAVSPGDIGVICFHRAQVSPFTIFSNSHTALFPDKSRGYMVHL